MSDGPGRWSIGVAEKKEWKGRPVANDNGVEAGESDAEKQRRFDALILTVARSLARQIAREEFARLKALSANGNRSSDDGEDK